MEPRYMLDTNICIYIQHISLTTIDTLIAAIALEHSSSVFTVDQDFSRIAGITRLALYRF
jgi:predicted nucleic acid-binding protein